MKRDFLEKVFCGKKKMAKLEISILLVLALIFGMLPDDAAFTASAALQGICGHHTEHYEECGYVGMAEGEAGNETEPQPANEVTPEDDFRWYVNGDEIWVSGYKGTATDIVIPATYQGKAVKGIWVSAFCGNTTVESVILPEGFTAIMGSAFQECTSLRSITIPDSVQSIGRMAFDRCKALESVSIRGVTSLDSYAFRECRSLRSVEMPYSIQEIPDYAFQFCENLTSVTIPDSVKSIGAYAFNYCQSLTSIKIPDSVETLGTRVFSFCTSLESVILPKGLKEIPDGAFDDCEKLTTAEIPDTVTSIGEWAFASCNLASIKIPDGITKIKDYTFMNCVFATLELPDGITSIGESAFNSCRNLTTIVIPDGVTSIGKGAFGFCQATLTNPVLEIPQSVQAIGENAFLYVRFSSVIYPDGLDLSGTGLENTVDKIRYRADAQGNLTINHIEPGKGKKKVVISDELAKKPVLLVEEEFRDFVSEDGHTHRGGTATCARLAQCVICNAEYGELEGHLYGDAAGRDEGTHSRECSVCGDVQLEDCTYEYDTIPGTGKGHTGTCAVCGHSIALQAHSYGEWTQESENHYVRACAICAYNVSAEISAPAGQITVEYGKTGEQVLAVKVEGTEAVYQWHCEGMALDGEHAADIILPAEMALGTYTYQCAVMLPDREEAIEYSVVVKVVAADLSRAKITLADMGEMVYDGSEKTLRFTVELDGRQLGEGKDYTVSYRNHINAGMAEMAITGTGSYTNSKTQEYTIAPAVPQIRWEKDVFEMEYTGSTPQIPAPAVRLVGGDTFDGTIQYLYAVENSEDYVSGLPVAAGKYTVKAYLAAAGNYAAAESDNMLELTITAPECTHENTVLKNEVDAACGMEGYTGDTCCADCGTVLAKGEGIPALEHDWEGKVIKQPTVQEEGQKRYTCLRCNEVYEESIPKLPGTIPTPGGGSTPGTPTPGGEITPTPGGESTPGTPTPGGEITPTPGGGSTPGTPTPGGEITPTPSTDATPTPDGENEPTQGIQATPTPKPETRPEMGKPFIRKESGMEGMDQKVGWASILLETGEAKAGSVIIVDMNGTTIVPKDMLKQIRDKNLAVFFDLGEGILWRMDGKDIANGQTGDIDLAVTTGTKKIPADIVNAIAEKAYHLQLHLAYEGDFGFRAFLSLNLGEENAGLNAVLYYYNVNSGELEQISTTEIAPDGMAWLEFTHASDYLVVVKQAVNVAEEKKDDGTRDKTEKENGDKIEDPAKEDDSKIEDTTGKEESDKTEENTETDDKKAEDKPENQDNGNGKEVESTLPDTGLPWNRPQCFLFGMTIFLAGFGIISFQKKQTVK